MATKTVELKEPTPKVKFDERGIRKELNEICHEHNDEKLQAEAVVQRAQDPDSALHSQFEWDDGKAAHQHRLMQARSLIRRILVTMPDDSTETAVGKYVSLRSDRRLPGGGYRETQSVLSNAELLAELEATAKADLDGVLRRYEMLKGLVARVRKAAGIPVKKAGSRPLPKKG